MSTDDEASLPDAIDQLYAAVSGLIDPVKQLIAGTVVAGPSPYETLVSEIPASSSGEVFSRGVGRSLPTVWCEALDLQVQIDTRTKALHPPGDSTPARLRGLAGKRWRPQDTRTVREAAEEIGSWRAAIQALVDPEHVKQVSAPCPACQKRWHYRQSAGETVRVAALALVTETGCRCLVCGAFWPPEKYLFLMRLLGIAAPAGVLP